MKKHISIATLVAMTVITMIVMHASVLKVYGITWHDPESVILKWVDGISLAITPDWSPHIIYRAENASSDDTIFHTTKTNGSWQFSYVEVADGVHSCPAVVSDSVGVLHATYLCNTDRPLHYAISANSGATWTVKDVGPLDSDWGVDIALGPGGCPVISHNGCTHILRVSMFDGANWSTTDVPDAPSCANTAIAVDGSGNIHVGFLNEDSENVCYVGYNASTSMWGAPIPLEYVGPICYNYILDLTVIPEDAPAITYYEGIFGNLRYAEWNGVSWDTSTVDSGAAQYNCHGPYPSLAIGPDNRPHISYIAGGDLRFASRDGRGWKVEILDNDLGGMGPFTDLVFDSCGIGHIAYTKGNPGGIYYTGEITITASHGMQILIPLYSYPNWYDPDNYIWDDVAKANSRVPITAIINPSNGPGGCPPNDDYQHGLEDLRNAGVTIIGYVYTSYGTRDVNSVKDDVDLYNQCFDIDGIFFDEVPSSADKLDYYEELYKYVKSRPNLDKVVLNPGTHIDVAYISRPACDIAVIFEGSSEDWHSYQPDGYLPTYQAERFAVLVYEVPDIDTLRSDIQLAADRNIAHVYLTDDTPPNPWDSLPVFWQCEVYFIASALDTIAPTVSSVTPADNATNVAVNTVIAATFSEAMDSSTITTTTFLINDGTSNIAGIVTFSGLTATFTPAADLDYSTTHTAAITTATKDLAGNALEGACTWSFTTGTCAGDFNKDGDVDGSDLAELAADLELLTLSSFASEFGRTDCLD